MSTFVFFLGEVRNDPECFHRFLCYSLSDRIFFCNNLFLLSLLWSIIYYCNFDN